MSYWQHRGPSINLSHPRRRNPSHGFLDALHSAQNHSVVRVGVMSPKWLSFVGLLAIWPGPIQAHDIYKHLVNEMGDSCCDATDCRPVPYRLRAIGRYTLF